MSEESKKEEVRAPVADLIGFRVVEMHDGKAVVLLQTGPQHANPRGALHGGILCDIADAAMGMAYASTLPTGTSFATVELKINFFRPVWNALLRAEAKVVHRGKITGYIECEIKDENERLIAKVGTTCMVLEGDRARNR